MAYTLGETGEHAIGKVITLIVVFALLGGVAVSFFANVKTLVTAFNNTSATGNTVVDGFLSVFGLIVAIVAVFALIALVQQAAKGKN